MFRPPGQEHIAGGTHNLRTGPDSLQTAGPGLRVPHLWPGSHVLGIRDPVVQKVHCTFRTAAVRDPPWHQVVHSAPPDAVPA
jgi:hypothetical protein